MNTSKKELASVLKQLGTICKRSYIPVLENVLITSTGLTVTDLDIIYTIKMDTGAADPFLVPIDQLKQAVKVAKATDSITIEPGTVRAGGYEATFTTYEVADYPESANNGINTVGGVPGSTINSLFSALAKAFPFRSTDETRHVLNGAYFCRESKAIIGTNGRALAAVNLPLEFPSFNLPFSKLYATLPETTGLAAMYDTDSTVIIDTNEFRIEAKKIEGCFPNWRQVVPDYNHCKHLSFAIEATAKQVLDLASSKEDDGQALLIFAADDNNISIVSRATGARLNVPGSFRGVDRVERQDQECHDHDYFHSAGRTVKQYITMNATLLATAIGSGFTKWTMSDDAEKSPFQPILSQNETGLAVIMPMTGKY